ncbi:MAG TPA: type II secretion system F family protein [Candidatus Paceibacterota bacterium]|nr:type II secretion system F family protein [Candidatus Paceibacterota bacterium]
MTKFQYKAQLIATAGEVGGVAEAKDKFELAHKLKDEGKLLISATPVTGFHFNMDAINAHLTRVDLRDKILLANNLATMIQAGLPLSRALGIILKQTTNPKLKQVLASLVDSINKGMTLSDALNKFPDIFPDVFISMVRAGEESGGLVEALQVVGGQMEKTYTLTKKVKGAMMYPMVVTTVMIAVGVLMMIYVVPGLAQTFAEANVALPTLTKIFIVTADFLKNDSIVAAISLVVLIVGVVLFKRTKVGNRTFAFVALKVPVFGILVKQYNTALVTRTLSSLISSGVDIVRAIDITRDVSSNVFYRETLDAAKEDVQKGVPLSQSFVKNAQIYPLMVGDMMEVGEETGQLSQMLKKIATYYEQEVEQATSDMSKLFEPILMVMIGTFVGLFAMAMISPMYSIMSTIN